MGASGAVSSGSSEDPPYVVMRTLGPGQQTSGRRILSKGQGGKGKERLIKGKRGVSRGEGTRVCPPSFEVSDGQCEGYSSKRRKYTPEGRGCLGLLSGPQGWARMPAHGRHAG